MLGSSMSDARATGTVIGATMLGSGIGDAAATGTLNGTSLEPACINAAPASTCSYNIFGVSSHMASPSSTTAMLGVSSSMGPISTTILGKGSTGHVSTTILGKGRTGHISTTMPGTGSTDPLSTDIFGTGSTSKGGPALTRSVTSHVFTFPGLCCCS
jgi:hypothetical protein